MYVCILIIVFEGAHLQIHTFKPRREWTRHNLFSSIAFNRFLLWPLRNDLFHSHIHTVKLSEELHLSVVVFVSSLSPVWSGEERVFCSYSQPLSTTPTVLKGTGLDKQKVKQWKDRGRGKKETKKIKEQISKMWRDWKGLRGKMRESGRSRELGGER